MPGMLVLFRSVLCVDMGRERTVTSGCSFKKSPSFIAVSQNLSTTIFSSSMVRQSTSPLGMGVFAPVPAPLPLGVSAPLSGAEALSRVASFARSARSWAMCSLTWAAAWAFVFWRRRVRSEGVKDQCLYWVDWRYKSSSLRRMIAVARDHTRVQVWMVEQRFDKALAKGLPMSWLGAPGLRDEGTKETYTLRNCG